MSQDSQTSFKVKTNDGSVDAKEMLLSCLRKMPRIWTLIKETAKKNEDFELKGQMIPNAVVRDVCVAFLRERRDSARSQAPPSASKRKSEVMKKGFQKCDFLL